MIGMAALAVWKGPFRLVSICSFQCAASISQALAAVVVPALAMTTSRRPSSQTPASRAA
jgi:hypothetical protein